MVSELLQLRVLVSAPSSANQCGLCLLLDSVTADVPHALVVLSWAWYVRQATFLQRESHFLHRPVCAYMRSTTPINARTPRTKQLG